MPDRTNIPLTIQAIRDHRADRAYIIITAPKSAFDHNARLDNINMMLNPMQLLTSKRMKHAILTGITA